jgi:hypothetical protein
MIMEKFIRLPDFPVVPQALADGPDNLDAGTTTVTVTAFQLADSGNDFVGDGVSVGDIAYNVATNEYAFVTAVGALATDPLTLDADIFALAGGQLYRIMTLATAFQLQDTDGAFEGRVNVGDLVVTGPGLTANVTNVADAVLTLDRPIITDTSFGNIYTVYSADGQNSILINASGVASVDYNVSTYCTVSYIDRTVGGDLNALTINHTADTSAQEFHNALNNALVSAYETNWRDVVTDLVLPQGMRITKIS